MIWFFYWTGKITFVNYTESMILGKLFPVLDKRALMSTVRCYELFLFHLMSFYLKQGKSGKQAAQLKIKQFLIK